MCPAALCFCVLTLCGDVSPRSCGLSRRHVSSPHRRLHISAACHIGTQSKTKCIVLWNRCSPCRLCAVSAVILAALCFPLFWPLLMQLSHLYVISNTINNLCTKMDSSLGHFGYMACSVIISLWRILIHRLHCAFCLFHLCSLLVQPPPLPQEQSHPADTCCRTTALKLLPPVKRWVTYL